MNIIDDIRERAAEQQKTVVLAESHDKRVLEAAHYLVKEKIAKVVLVGSEEAINARATGHGMQMHELIEYSDPEKSEKLEQYAENFYKRRKHKGISMEDARRTVRQPLFFAASMIAADDADCGVAGSIATTGEVLRAALQAIGLKKGSQVVSSIFLMAMTDGNVMTYGDCGVVPYPNREQLATIAIDSAETHRRLTNTEPTVGMLSFSTKGSARHERVELVQQALELVREQTPKLAVDGEFQFDTAFVPEVGSRKAPDSKVAGQCNVYIFPNLDAGNIAYKITERLGGAVATGPIIQGLKKPMMDLSRGCSWEDIVNAAAVSVLMGD